MASAVDASPSTTRKGPVSVKDKKEEDFKILPSGPPPNMARRRQIFDSLSKIISRSYALNNSSALGSKAISHEIAKSSHLKPAAVTSSASTGATAAAAASPVSTGPAPGGQDIDQKAGVRVAAPDGSWKTVTPSSDGPASEAAPYKWGTYVFAWGAGYQGQLGRSKKYAMTPEIIKVNLAVRQVAAGALHSALVTDEGKLLTWGNGREDQLGYTPSTYTNQTTPSLVGGIIQNCCIVKVACGAAHSICLDDQGRIHVVGKNELSQLGVPNVRKLTQFRQLTAENFYKQGPLPKFQDVACGENHSVAISVEGHVYVWGANKHGQLGLGLRPRSNDDMLGLGSGSGLAGTGRVGSSSGKKNKNEAKEDIETKEPKPRLLESWAGKKRCVAVSCGSIHTTLQTDDGEVYVCGFGEHFFPKSDKNDHRNFQFEPTHIPFPNNDKIMQTASGQGHILALNFNGDVYAWGSGDYGQLGHGLQRKHPGDPPVFLNAPRLILEGKNIKQVAAGRYHSLALTAYGILYSWGCGENGQLGHGEELGNGEDNKVLFPKVIEQALGVVVGQIACGAHHTLALTSTRWDRTHKDVEEWLEAEKLEYDLKLEHVNKSTQRGLTPKDLASIAKQMETRLEEMRQARLQQQQEEQEQDKRLASLVLQRDMLQDQVRKQLVAPDKAVSTGIPPSLLHPDPEPRGLARPSEPDYIYAHQQQQQQLMQQQQTFFGTTGGQSGSNLQSLTMTAAAAAKAAAAPYLVSVDNGPSAIKRPYTLSTSPTPPAQQQPATGGSNTTFRPRPPGKPKSAVSSSSSSSGTTTTTLPRVHTASRIGTAPSTSSGPAPPLSLDQFDLGRGPYPPNSDRPVSATSTSSALHPSTAPAPTTAPNPLNLLALLDQSQSPRSTLVKKDTNRSSVYARTAFMQKAGEMFLQLKKSMPGKGKNKSEEKAENEDLEARLKRVLELQREYNALRANTMDKEKELSDLVRQSKLLFRGQEVFDEVKRGLEERKTLLDLKLNTVTINTKEEEANERNYKDTIKYLKKEEIERHKRLDSLRRELQEADIWQRKLEGQKRVWTGEQVSADDELHHFHQEVQAFREFMERQLDSMQNVTSVTNARKQHREEVKSKRSRQEKDKVAQRMEKLSLEMDKKSAEAASMAENLRHIYERLGYLEQKFQLMSAATGLTDPEAIVNKFLLKEEIKNELRAEQDRKRQKLAALEKQKQDLTTALNALKEQFKDSTWKDVDSYEDRFRDADARAVKSQKAADRLQQKLAFFQEGIITLLMGLPSQPADSSIPPDFNFPPAPERTIDILKLLEDRLALLHTSVQQHQQTEQANNPNYVDGQFDDDEDDPNHRLERKKQLALDAFASGKKPTTPSSSNNNMMTPHPPAQPRPNPSYTAPVSNTVEINTAANVNVAATPAPGQ